MAELATKEEQSGQHPEGQAYAMRQGKRLLPYPPLDDRRPEGATPKVMQHRRFRFDGGDRRRQDHNVCKAADCQRPASPTLYTLWRDPGRTTRARRGEKRTSRGQRARDRQRRWSGRKTETDLGGPR